VLANLAAMPVVSVLVMPAGLFGVAAIPFGFDGVFWHLMGAGIAWMVAVAQGVAALPGAIGRMAAFGTGPLLAASAGIVMLGLLRTKLRWSGAGLIVLGTLWAVSVPPPDILVAADGRSVGVRDRAGVLRVMRTSKDAFLLREWLAADADARPASDASLREGVSCDDAGCVVAAADGRLIALSLRPEALADDCARAAVIVAASPPPAGCAALVIDRDLLQRHGALALRKTASGYAVTEVNPRGFDRPWAPANSAPASSMAANSAPTNGAPALTPADGLEATPPPDAAQVGD
jgi:competence protein ComEC